MKFITDETDTLIGKKRAYTAPNITINEVKMNENMLLEFSEVTIDEGFSDGGDM